NAWTGKVIANPLDGYYFPGGTQTIWSFDFTDEPCKPTEWPEPTHEPICGAEDKIIVPDDTEEVVFVISGKGGPGQHTVTVSAVWTYDDSVLETWMFTDTAEECPTTTTVPPTTT